MIDFWAGKKFSNMIDGEENIDYLAFILEVIN